MKRPYSKTCTLGFLLLLFLPSQATAQHDPPRKHSQQSWLGFAVYPGARDLSDEWIRGTRGEEIHAVCFATTDDMAKVAAFYARKDSARAEKDDDGSVTLRHKKDIILSLYPIASKLNYPSCKREARTEEKTVIFITQLLSRGSRKPANFKGQH